jgi:ATP-dependent RNA helicase RhlE
VLMPFSKTGLSEVLLNALKAEGYEKPYPIQQQAIPAVLKGHDVLGIAQTGSGKTLAFALPILMNLGGLLKKSSKEKNREPSALILVPTRELAVQVEEVFTKFNFTLENPFTVKAVYGGVSINPQMKGLYGVNILIATPGRLLDLHSSKAVALGKVKMLVIDEADKMLNLGFKDEMDQIIKLLPTERQNLLFSATLNDDVKSVNQLVLKKPIIVKIKPRDENIDLIKQSAYWVEDERKGPLLRHLIKSESMHQVLVFTSSVFKADAVAKKLNNNGLDAMAIHSKKSQGARTDALTKFKNKKLRVLIATDLLSRGIDIAFLPFVINYELPRSPKDFIHRIGRTGRAESPGQAITFVSEEEEHHFKVIQKKLGKKIDATDAHLLELS